MPPPIILLAFANDRTGQWASLREELARERREIRAAFEEAERAGLCKVEVLVDATPGDVVKAFQNPAWRGNIAVFHFSGHADSDYLLFESAEGGIQVTTGGNLAGFLGRQPALALVFLNGCATQGHVADLLAAGVQAVIATQRKVDSFAACEFAILFYRALAQGKLSLQNAFEEARAGAKLMDGSATRGLSFAGRHHPAPPEEISSWILHKGGKAANDWSLNPDPLLTLPLPADIGLPVRPFMNLQSFSREHAAVFFGRGKAIKAVYDQLTGPDTEPILLLCGQSGVGKSSFLYAGLLPRLESRFEIVVMERPPPVGTDIALAELLDSGVSLAAAWRVRQGKADKPLLLVIDHAEKLLPGNNASLDDWAVLRQQWAELFGDTTNAGTGKLVLAFRKEWLADITSGLDAYQLPHALTVLERLDRAGLIEAIEGVCTDTRCQAKYRLTLGKGPDGQSLSAQIAADLLVDPQAPLAPTLQILLRRLWEQAKYRDDANPLISFEIYSAEKRYGLLLDDFLQERLTELESINPDLIQSGLALDILHQHTDELGASRVCLFSELEVEYAHVLPQLRIALEFFESCFILANATSAGRNAPKSSRLSHDTLAPLVRREFHHSLKPGQRAKRLLEERVRRALTVLPQEDLPFVEKGQSGMRLWTTVESQLVESARQVRATAARKRLNQRLALAVLCLALLAATGKISWQWWDGLSYQSRVLAVNARSEAEMGHASLGLLLALQALPSAGHIRPWESEAETALAYALSLPRDLLAPPQITPALDLAFSADGLQMAVATNQGVWLWNMAGDQWNAKPASAHFLPEQKVYRISFSLDSRYLLSVSEDHSVRIWEAKTGRERLRLMHDNSVFQAEFTQENAAIVTLSHDGKVRVWQLPELAQGGATDHDLPTVLTEKTNPPRVLAQGNSKSRLALTPQGKLLALSLDNALSLIDWESGKEMHRFPHSQAISQIAFSSDGRFATASANGDIRVWEGREGGEYLHLNQGAGVDALAFSPDGRWLATASRDNGLKIWSLASGLVLHDWRLENQLWRVAFTANGNALGLATEQAAPRILTLAGSRETFRLEHGASVESAEFSPDGHWIATASVDGTARIVSAENGELRFQLPHDGEVNLTHFSADGNFLATAASPATVRIWDVHQGKELVRMNHDATVTSVQFDPTGQFLLTASADGSARLWATISGHQQLRLNHGSPVIASSFSPNGKWVLTATVDGIVRLWQADSGKEKYRWSHGAVIRQTSFSPDGAFVVVAAADHAARVYAVADGREKLRLWHQDSVESAVFSPDGHWIVTASTDRTARVWDADNGRERWRLPHPQVLAYAEFSPDGRRIVTAVRESLDDAMQLTGATVFDLDSGQKRFFLPQESTVTRALFSPDGLSVLTYSPDRTARLWRRPALLLSGSALVEHVRAHGLIRQRLSANELKQYFLE